MTDRVAELRSLAEEAKNPGSAMVYDLLVAIARHARSQQEAERMIADRLAPLADGMLALVAVVEKALPRCSYCAAFATQADRGPAGDDMHVCDAHASIAVAENVGADGEPFITLSDLDYADALRALGKVSA
jgi:hypothetical protein